MNSRTVIEEPTAPPSDSSLKISASRTFHTVGAKTKKGAEKARDALIFRLESDGGAVGSSMTVREFMEQIGRAHV